MYHDITLADIGQQYGRYRRHATGKYQRVFRFIPYAEPVFENFLIGTVKARIDKPVRPAGSLAGNAFKMAFARCRIFKCKGRGQENRRLQGAFGQDRKSTRLNSSHVKISYAV